jgi:hypothetical protein
MLVVGLAAGMAAGTKLNFLLPAAVIVLGLVLIAPRGARWRALVASGLAALAGGGYWYLRNLIHSGSPVPWIHHLGPFDLPSPGQTLGGREAHSVSAYLTNGSVWSEWFLPGLHGGFWLIWPLLGGTALAGLVLVFVPGRPGRSWLRRIDPALAIGGLVGLATAAAWFVAPTSASGPHGMPQGFESGLRYLAPALVLGLALLPATPPLRRAAAHLASLGARSPSGLHRGGNGDHAEARSTFASDGGGNVNHGPFPRAWLVSIGAILVVLAIVVGYPVQRHYLQNRYRDPTFTTPGLNAAFAWARDVSSVRIATTSTRQYPLFGTDLSNRVAYVGTEEPHGGFEAAKSCPEWRRLLNEGHYDYVVASWDRIEAGQPPFPPEVRWTESPGAKVVLKKAPTVVFRLTGPLDPATCPG